MPIFCTPWHQYASILNESSYFCHMSHKICSRFAWWRHLMETFSALLALWAWNSLVTDEFPSQRPVTQNFDIFFDLSLNKGWVNNRDAGDLRRHWAHYDVTVIRLCFILLWSLMSLIIICLLIFFKIVSLFRCQWKYYISLDEICSVLVQNKICSQGLNFWVQRCTLTDYDVLIYSV